MLKQWHGVMVHACPGDSRQNIVIICLMVAIVIMHQVYQLLTLGACARVTVVVLCVCLSVTTLAATYLVYESKLLCCKVPYGVPNA